ncbi:MAG: peptide deformylase [Planctomycetota bacterium]|nr:peptide deformylase [Planctomycetota bacterium]
MTTPSRSSPDPASEIPDVGDLHLRYYPDPLLGKRCRPLGVPNRAAQACIQRMIELMYEHQGIGLAAPQVGWNARVFVTNVDPDGLTSEGDRVFIDPQLEPLSEVPEAEDEGCLSLPGIRLEVERATALRVQALGFDGEPYQLDAAGLLARCIQHENDHLDGILITARVSTLQRIAVRSKLRELKLQWDEQERRT